MVRGRPPAPQARQQGRAAAPLPPDPAVVFLLPPLQDLEAYSDSVVGGKPLVTWNLELDTLRADLGALPGKRGGLLGRGGGAKWAETDFVDEGAVGWGCLGAGLC